ncbi:hypothetical protein MAR_003383 [Mya arenaria]|uniref:Helicase ATP-binding domain-containing protein n=1 Tax=Mya arenaria TaxID=6604 RepID=A0ABY7G5V8_MYAAR|nr:hypothetical protein MAR_003383 [Mya arenaria]
MFTSPETVLGNEMWRDVLMCSQFRQRLCAIVVDEAHTVVQWSVLGEGTKNSDPFREWFGKIGEVRSLCPGILFLVLTATASKRTRQAIEKKLCMALPVEIVKCPHLEKSSFEVEVMFQWLLCALEKQNETLP